MVTKSSYQELENEIKKLKQSLEEEKRKCKFTNFFENSKAVMLQICSETKKILKANDAAINFYGYTKADLLQKKISDLNILQDNEIAKLMGMAIKNKIVLKRHKHRIASGEILDVEVYISIYKENDKIIFVATIFDITNRIKAEQKLKNSEEYYKTLMENSTDVISIIDENGTSLFRSTSYKQVMGYTVEEMLNKNIFDLICEDDREKLKMQLKASIENPDLVQNIFFRANHKDGTLRQLEGTAKNMLHSPIINGFIINYRDVTERIKVEKALKESETNYKNIIDNLTDAYYRANANGIVTLASSSCMKMFGYSNMGEVIGGNIEILYPNPKIRKQFLDILIKNGKVKNFRTKLLKKNGEEIFVETSANILIDKDGNYAGVEGIVRDITDRKKSEQALIYSEKQLRESNKTKDKFFSIIAHDLRSPFNAIIGFSELLSDSYDKFDVKQQKEFINIIKESSKNAYKLLDNLLLWSRSQQGAIDFCPTNENLYLLAEQVAELSKRFLKDKKINFSNNILKNIYVNVDKNMVLTIFRNLINNAIKFTKKGGSITLISSFLQNNENNKFVNITIKDSGVGIPQKNIKKLFSISGNVSTNGTEDEKGTGLGLIICKEFIDKHSGKIWAESEVGKGSSFIFTLPLSS